MSIKKASILGSVGKGLARYGASKTPIAGNFVDSRLAKAEDTARQVGSGIKAISAASKNPAMASQFNKRRQPANIKEASQKKSFADMLAENVEKHMSGKKVHTGNKGAAEEWAAKWAKIIADKLNDSDAAKEVRKEKEWANDWVRKTKERNQIRSEGRKDKLLTGLMFGAGAVGAGIIGAGAIHGASKMHDSYSSNKTLKWLKANHPELVESEKDMANFKILTQYAPTLAANQNVAHGYLMRAKQLGITPHEFVSDLIKLQETKDKGSYSRSARDSAMRGLFKP